MHRPFGRKRWFAFVSALITTVPLLAIAASPASASPQDRQPRWLQPTLVNVDPTLARSFYGPQIAVNPRNPNNIVVAAIADTGYTQACLASEDPSCQLVPISFEGLPIATEPEGVFEPNLGFDVRGLFVSFDRGRTFKQVDVSQLRPPGVELYSQTEGELAVAPDGTFYLEWDAVNWGTPTNFVPDSGVAVSKSTDGGLTWSQPVLTETPGDFPAITVDQSTGTVYALSGLSITPLGPRSTGNPNSPNLTPFGDAFVAASKDGVHWTQPQRNGGEEAGNQFTGADEDGVAAAFGEVATTFVSTSAAACAFFVGGTAPCTVFQTSRNAGATWSRHSVPMPATVTGVNTPLVAANPSRRGHYAVAFLNDSHTEFYIYQTRNSGNTWSGPTIVANDGSTHWNPWLAYSQNGILGLVWRTNEGAPYPALTPYSIWAAISYNGGHTFSQPLEVNCCSPAAIPGPFIGYNGNIPQDRSSIALSNKGVYVGWGDWRTGERNMFFSAINYQSFHFSSAR
jgi:hypothetical protein